jgi:ABC-2 type transport system ATP-binding protein
MQELMIEVKKLKKVYGKHCAVNEISFDVTKGEIFGLLGPNGAGKTTTIEMLVGLRKPDGGTATLGGYGISKDLDKMKEVLGVQLQTTSLFELLTVKELLELYASFYKNNVDLNILIEEMLLLEKKDSRVKNLSGGQKQRLAIALALVHDPEIIFLDEPTTGLDPQARRTLWEIIQRLKERDKTIVLTTHYMDEAHVLCDRIAIIDQGEIIALNTPAQLVKKLNADTAISFKYDGEDEITIDDLSGVNKSILNGDFYTLYSSDLQATLADFLEQTRERDIAVEDLQIRTSTLEDVFISLTGRSLREE